VDQPNFPADQSCDLFGGSPVAMVVQYDIGALFREPQTDGSSNAA
jgi:hypothetical protein